ncbi:Fc.00g010160.m01.CDS01 [Cosmosporella sp. VM-42]
MTEMHAAHDLSHEALGGPIRIQDGQFADNYGRTLCLRGLNVSGASKLPTEPNGLSHLTDGFYEHRTVTFTGRPFPIEEAPLHFRRLRAWGMSLVRLLVTWESIGHSGPNPDTDLDLEYIAYLRTLVDLMPKYGIKCFICAHQDVWSRFSGGSGAPGWTFEAAGLDIEAFTETGAAYVHGQDEERRANGHHNAKEPSGPFLWPSGYQKLAASTMATLFWAGDALAPRLKCQRVSPSNQQRIEEVSIQSLLQDAFIEAFGQLADAIGGLEACIGFEPLNEPHRGLINLHNFYGWNYDTDLHIGHYPSLAQALALGSGYSQTVNFYVKSWPFPTRISHRSVVDPKGRSAWLSHDPNTSPFGSQGMGQCVWKAHGVWEWDDKKQTPVVLRPEYFDTDHRPGREGQKVEWYRDFYGPFLQRFSERVSRGRPQLLSFIEPIPNEFVPPWPTDSDQNGATISKQTYAVKTVIDSRRPQNFVYAPHFYDLNVLFSKYHAWMSVNVQGLSRGMFVLRALYFGAKGLRKNYKKQISNILNYGRASLGQVPTVIGEVGIPFDINGGAAFQSGRYKEQRQLMHALIGAMEDNNVAFTLWNYNPHNRVEYGDGWNKEDFSITNGDEVEENGPLRPDYRNRGHEDNELYRGGRLLDVVIRPYAAKVAGQPLRSSWDCRTLRYEFEWKSIGSATEKTTEKSCLTEVFLPKYHYGGQKIRVHISDGEWTFDREKQTLYVRQEKNGKDVVHHSLVVQICDLDQHLLQRAEQRRQAFPPTFPFGLLPIKAEAWLDELDLRYILAALVLALAGIVVVLAIGIQAR